MIPIKKIFTFFLIMITSTFITSGCIKSQETHPQPISRNNYFLGTIITIKLYDHASDKVFNEIFSKLKEIEDKMTINAENSEVIHINSKAGKNAVKVSSDTFQVIKKAKEFSKLSDGKFDISIGPLVKLWNIGPDRNNNHVPTQNEINKKKAFVDYNQILLNEKHQSILLKKEGMILDLGGIAKGYAADEIAKILKKHHVMHAIINLGGNVYAHGNKLDGTPWKIGIQNPFTSRGDYMGIIAVSDKTVVTSGIYERFFEKDGKIYHHILDPHTGYPVENNLAGVSIIADSSIDADALSTSAFALGIKKGIEMIEKLNGVDAIFITKDSKVYVTSGLINHFQLTNNDFIQIKYR